MMLWWLEEARWRREEDTHSQALLRPEVVDMEPAQEAYSHRTPQALHRAVEQASQGQDRMERHLETQDMVVGLLQEHSMDFRQKERELGPRR